MSTLVFGHKNPDTDSVTSAIATSYLKNKLGFDTKPCVLGNIRKEAKFVLDYFKLSYPTLIENVKTQVKDLNYDKIEGISADSSILHAYKLMEDSHLRTLPIIDENKKLLGIITMKDIAMQLIRGDVNHIKTSLSNIASDLEGKVLVNCHDIVNGKLSIIAFYYKTIAGTLSEKDIIIVGDRYDIIEHAIDSKVQLIIITGGNEIPEKYLNLAKENNVSMICVPSDTYTTSKLINQTSFVSSIMKSDILKFEECEYIDDIKEDISSTNFRYYPVVNKDNVFLGFIGRKHLLDSNKKKVILVDHNESAQSVDGLDQAEILEIIDHHKIGGISTSIPINFRNMTVGSTCTIVYNMFKENNIEIPYEIAGLLLSGIISDTLLFKSPTTTDIDKKAVVELNKILNLDLEKYAMEMFKSGTSLEGYSIEEIVNMDFKEFNLEGLKTGIGQVFTLDIDSIFNKKDEFLDYINNTKYDICLLAITDILKEGSYLLYKAKDKLISTAFNIEANQGVFVDGAVSRKKQLVPKLTEAIKIAK
ncbi:putative manganese-dependent inorganic diphosphatase [Tepidibacter formicigenes]|jgi:manganese-dependent inorganic pyrophosphatase|uniref:inorganic diphosphatase n=1 Tax=Tepidibacter formicigenes DSM 15518 TaxID=1123349 RepID=A0A1M6TJL5_9FIRM|nr:putative manganese-dependent inorganic diphosphatase [Tepidibacter formicigenes]SHK57151.1 manganese-dependent inorganic pyrophosphatase [Tepidibacter formicigenes DSM 15518]